MTAELPEGWIHDPADAGVAINASGYLHASCPSVPEGDDVEYAVEEYRGLPSVGRGMNRFSPRAVTITCPHCRAVCSWVDNDWDPDYLTDVREAGLGVVTVARFSATELEGERAEIGVRLGDGRAGTVYAYGPRRLDGREEDDTFMTAPVLSWDGIDTVSVDEAVAYAAGIARAADIAAVLKGPRQTDCVGRRRREPESAPGARL
jgi:hypothetical protein